MKFDLHSMFNSTAGRGDIRQIDPPSSYEEPSSVEELCEELNIESKSDDSNIIQNPEHYKKGVSPYDVAIAMYGAEGLLKFVTINSVKYISRYPHKFKGDPEKQLDDLLKARRSLDTAIELHKEIHGTLHIRHG